MLIDKLQDVGIGAADISKLKASGLTTIKSIQMAHTRNLNKIKGLSEAKIEKIKEAANKLLPNQFCSALELEQRYAKTIYKISSGSKEFDKLLGGGVRSRSITEAFGEFRTGKTQLSHTLAVMAQMPVQMGGGGGKAAFIDTEGTFRPDRIKAIASRFGLDPEAALENITYARAHNSEHQMELINMIACHMAEENNYKLLVVDSIMALFRVDFCGRGE
ncbi:Meiotic recombination protein dmc1 [Quaeritorhiza haematococci]|nr:Meiotic recombination protein dmc1 [Quaeritorhiza haematococci]